MNNVSSPILWEAACNVLDEVRKLQPAQRVSYLDRHVLDPKLRLEVEGYLAFEGVKDPLFDAPELVRRSFASVVLGESPVEEFSPGAMVGNYRIERWLGAGGMGAVYEATDSIIDRRVALKFLPLLRADASERLVHESRLQAKTAHRHIAQLITIEQTENGRPFAVMEYVDGERVTTYAGRLRLAIHARQRLLEQVCEAVQHAHEQRVVHLDLKPSNVLVVEEGGRPAVKVVDFGIGQILEKEDMLASAEHGRRFTPRPLTPTYAAPEQLLGKSATLATDVFSLGVLAYELLTGVCPFPRGSTMSSPIPLPSTVARHDHAQALVGDLDAIVIKAMQNDPDQRYRTVKDFYDDLLNHRTSRPIVARKATLAYTLSKFVGRHSREVIAAIGIIGLTVVAFVSVYQSRLQAERAAVLAEERQRTAEASEEFLVELLTAADPMDPEATGRPDTLTALELLALGTRRIGAELWAEPQLRARMWDATGEAHGRLGYHTEADSLLRLALNAKRSQRPVDSLGLARTMSLLATSLQTQGTGSAYNEAEPLFRQALRIRQHHISPGSPEYLLTAESHSNLGIFLSETGSDLQDALRHISASYAIYRDHPDATPWQIATMQNNLGHLYGRLDRYEEATNLLQTAASAFEEMLGDHPSTSGAYVNLGTLYKHYLKYDEAESAFRRALTIDRALLGSDHIYVASDLDMLGQVLTLNGHPDSSLVLHQEALEIRNHINLTNWGVAVSSNSLARAYIRLNKLDDARDQLAKAQQIIQTLGDRHRPLEASNHLIWGELYMAEGNAYEAVQHFKRSFDLRASTYKEDHVLIAESLLLLAEALDAQGERVLAVEHARQADSIYSARNLPSTHPARIRISTIMQ